jgi:predicted transcriptional regulator
VENKYTTKQIAEILGVSDRSVRRYLTNYFSVDNGVYKVSDKMLEILKKEHSPDSDIVVQEFTEDEYQEFHKRLSEYPILKERISDVLNELDYHKRSAESHNRQMEIILQTLQQRNFIEAKEKKLDK